MKFAPPLARRSGRMPDPRSRPLRKRIALIAVLAGMAASTAALAGESASPDVSYDDHTICAAATAAAERATPIPAQLLHAISLVDSGRQDDATQESFAWPWRSDEGRVGTECVSNGRIRGSAYN